MAPVGPPAAGFSRRRTGDPDPARFCSKIALFLQKVICKALRMKELRRLVTLVA
jgi:hypothetical protein